MSYQQHYDLLIAKYGTETKPDSAHNNLHYHKGAYAIYQENL